jgi:hypothetical protein
MVVRSLAATLGRPQQEADLWASWVQQRLCRGDGRLGPNPGLERYLADVIDAAHRSPGDDLFGRLARAEVDGRSLTRDELMGFGHLVLAAGRGTLVDAITGSVWYLAGHPDERARLARQPELLPVAVEEFLRHLSPLAHIGGGPGPTRPSGAVRSLGTRWCRSDSPSPTTIRPPSRTRTGASSTAGRTGTWRSATARTPASALTWPASSCAYSCASCWP